jgi:hypothetical protein
MTSLLRLRTLPDSLSLGASLELRLLRSSTSMVLTSSRGLGEASIGGERAKQA